MEIISLEPINGVESSNNSKLDTMPILPRISRAHSKPLAPKKSQSERRTLNMHLELSAALGELEGNGAAGEATVDLAVGIEAVVDTTTLLLVEDDLEGLGAVLLGAGALADNLDGVDEVGEDGVVDSGQSARAGALLGLGGARVNGALGAGQDAALGHEEDVAVGELLLELAGQTGGGS
jgi:hypothetical protein